MRNLISVVVLLSLAVGSGSVALCGERVWSKRFEKLVAARTGSYSWSTGVTVWRTENGKTEEKTVHETNSAATFVFGSSDQLRNGYGGDLFLWGYVVRGFSADLNNNSRTVRGLRLRRSGLHYNDLLKKGNALRFDVETSLRRVNEGEVFRMPDNTEWKALAIETAAGGNGDVIFEARAIRGTFDPGLKNSKNNSLILPLESSVTLSVRSVFGSPIVRALHCTLRTRTSDGPQAGQITLWSEGYSCIRDRKRRDEYGQTDNPDIKAGQTIELLPGRWCKVRKVVKPDPKKKIRGWIEFDTRPVAMKKQ